MILVTTKQSTPDQQNGSSLCINYFIVPYLHYFALPNPLCLKKDNIPRDLYGDLPVVPQIVSTDFLISS
jgi:hypothetical protein